jgi:hypothetical protein
MPLQATSGAASYDAFGGGAAVAPKYIEDFFQTWLRTGTGSSATVTTGLNASTNKSLVWTKSRSAATNHKLTDTVRGATKALSSNTTGAEVTDSQGLTAFSSTGYTIGTNTDYNNSGATYVDWQWLATPKFFDVVTYTGNGSTSTRTINHNLNAVPGVIIVKPISASGDWKFSHKDGYVLLLNTTDASLTAPTLNGGYASGGSSTVFSLVPNGGSTSSINANGVTYVAYLFAHNAGGFGLTGTDNVISCGSFITDGSGAATVSLGYEPQWLLVKATASSQWLMLDNMRGWSNGSGDNYLFANTSGAENPLGSGPLEFGNPTATGFDYLGGGASTTYIYIAIRRGPMKVPTTGTSVFSAVAETGNSSVKTINHGFPVDIWIASDRNNSSLLTSYNQALFTRLLGNANGFITSNTDAWGGGWGDAYFNFASNAGVPLVGQFSFLNNSGTPYVYWGFRRAPGFFDEVCYTGTGDFLTVPTNLGVQPELVFLKRRNSTSDWGVGIKVGDTTNFYSTLRLNSTAALGSLVAAFTGTGIFVPTAFNVSGGTYVAYLFASCPGVSKVGSFTGTGATQVINCGFTGGARFVLIKATSTSGDWYVWDSARGIVAGNDPYLRLNSTSAEVTNTDWVDTAASGFELSNAGGNLANSNGVSYIFLAIA